MVTKEIPAYIGSNWKETPRPVGEVMDRQGNQRGVYPIRPVLHSKTGSAYVSQEMAGVR